MKPNKKAAWIVLALAVIALTGMYLLLKIGTAGDRKNSSSTEFPDLEQVQLQAMPQDFDYDHQPVLGNPDAPIKIVEFGDYRCPDCQRWTVQVFPKLYQRYIQTNQIAFYYIHFPFLGPDSVLAANAGEILYAQKNEWFWKFHALINEFHGDKKEVWATKDFLVNLVGDHMPDVDLASFEQTLSQHQQIENVKKDYAIAERYQVNSVPSIFVNGKLLEEGNFEAIQAAIENELKSK